MGGLILGINTLYMLSCFVKQFALVGKGLILILSILKHQGTYNAVSGVARE